MIIVESLSERLGERYYLVRHIRDESYLRKKKVKIGEEGVKSGGWRKEG